MLIGVVGDIHLGINENKPLFNLYQKKCITHIYNEFNMKGIKDIIYLGDIFDKRYSISVKTLKQANDIFDNRFNQHFLLGNHDVTYKNSNELNSVELILGKKNNVVVNLPEEIEIGGKKILLVPWINKTNLNQSTEIINDSTADYLLGHLELNGFEMIKGIISRTGQFKSTLLKHFKHVITGHFHNYSQRKNITYLGAVCEMTWNDFGVDKYAGMIDTDTDTLHLIEIPYKLYDTIRIKKNEPLPNIDQFKDKIIKVYLYTKRTIKIEKFITQLDDICQSINVIDEQVITATEDFDIESHNMSILELWKSYLDEMNITKKDATIVNKIFQDVYYKVSIGEV